MGKKVPPYGIVRVKSEFSLFNSYFRFLMNKIEYIPFSIVLHTVPRQSGPRVTMQ
jgi:hypothetical protein